ncbi:hypothetical protein EDB19DRAFT_1907861 [Suillus lakei]|nr:hypothetical protein EDB19DRAFT_1907861 [Suillus lakei]
MPDRHVSQCKGKTTTIPKPARGSGLNPSGLPIADQLYLPTEQPQMSMFDFNPYRQSALGWPGYGDEQGLSFYRDVQGATLFGGAQSTSLFGDVQGISSFRDAQEQGPSLYDNAQGPSSFSNMQEQPGPFYDNLQGMSSYNERPNYYNDFQDAVDLRCWPAENLNKNNKTKTTLLLSSPCA